MSEFPSVYEGNKPFLGSICFGNAYRREFVLNPFPWLCLGWYPLTSDMII